MVSLAGVQSGKMISGSAIAVRGTLKIGCVGSVGDSESEATPALYIKRGPWDDHKR